LATLTRPPRRAFHRLLGLKRHLRCRSGAWIAGTRLTMDKGNRFNVPMRVNGKGTVTIGSGNSFGFGMATILGNGTILIQARTPQARITIGEKNATSNNISIVATDSINIGNRCQIGELVAIYDSDFHEINPAARNASAGEGAPVNIGNNVWLGSRVMVLKGVSIGDNSVVAAMAVVTKSLPSNCVAAGVPAKVVRIIE
jgi:maltose O-acetyltransferase